MAFMPASQVNRLARGPGADMVYLDANATQPLRPEAALAIQAAWALGGNPASVHAAGRAARRLLEDGRERIAAHFGAQSSRCVFVSGGTEANAAALHALRMGRRVLLGATEHDAVREAAPDAETLAVDRDGRVDLDALAGSLAKGGPALVCLMLANNETGVLHPIAEVSALCRAAGALLHVDAVQAAGRVPVKLAALGADSLAVSAHKLGGPAGIGAWLMADERTPRPLIAGGGQERGWRGGTAAVPLVAGFAAALDCAVTENSSRLAALRDSLETAALACGARVVASGAPRLPNTSCLVLPWVAAQTQVIALDLAGVAVSAGAACSSGKVAASHVLVAMGFGAQAGQAIRVSLPWNATESDVDAFAAAYRAMADRLARRAA